MFILDLIKTIIKKCFPILIYISYFICIPQVVTYKLYLFIRNKNKHKQSIIYIYLVLLFCLLYLGVLTNIHLLLIYSFYYKETNIFNLIFFFFILNSLFTVIYTLLKLEQSFWIFNLSELFQHSLYASKYFFILISYLVYFGCDDLLDYVLLNKEIDLSALHLFRILYENIQFKRRLLMLLHISNPISLVRLKIYYKNNSDISFLNIKYILVDYILLFMIILNLSALPLYLLLLLLNKRLSKSKIYKEILKTYSKILSSINKENHCDIQMLYIILYDYTLFPFIVNLILLVVVLLVLLNIVFIWNIVNVINTFKVILKIRKREDIKKIVMYGIVSLSINILDSIFDLFSFFLTLIRFPLLKRDFSYEKRLNHMIISYYSYENSEVAIGNTLNYQNIDCFIYNSKVSYEDKRCLIRSFSIELICNMIIYYLQLFIFYMKLLFLSVFNIHIAIKILYIKAEELRSDDSNLNEKKDLNPIHFLRIFNKKSINNTKLDYKQVFSLFQHSFFILLFTLLAFFNILLPFRTYSLLKYLIYYQIYSKSYLSIDEYVNLFKENLLSMIRLVLTTITLIFYQIFIFLGIILRPWDIIYSFQTIFSFNKYYSNQYNRLNTRNDQEIDIFNCLVEVYDDIIVYKNYLKYSLIREWRLIFKVILMLITIYRAIILIINIIKVKTNLTNSKLLNKIFILLDNQVIKNNFNENPHSNTYSEIINHHFSLLIKEVLLYPFLLLSNLLSPWNIIKSLSFFGKSTFTEKSKFIFSFLFKCVYNDFLIFSSILFFFSIFNTLKICHLTFHYIKRILSKYNISIYI